MSLMNNIQHTSYQDMYVIIHENALKQVAKGAAS